MVLSSSVSCLILYCGNLAVRSVSVLLFKGLPEDVVSLVEALFRFLLLILLLVVGLMVLVWREHERVFDAAVGRRNEGFD